MRKTSIYVLTMRELFLYSLYVYISLKNFPVVLSAKWVTKKNLKKYGMY